MKHLRDRDSGDACVSADEDSGARNGGGRKAGHLPQGK